MSEELNSEICRLCTLKTGSRLHIFEKEGEQRQLLFKIRSCLPIIVSKEDSLPKKICNRCVYKLDLFYEFRLSVLNSETLLKQHLLKALPTGEEVKHLDKMTENHKIAYAEAMQQHISHVASIQTKNDLEKGCQTQNGMRLCDYPMLKVPSVTQPGPEPYKPDSTFILPDDGMGFDEGVRVLRALGTWSPDYTASHIRPGMLQLPEHMYGESSQMTNTPNMQRKVTSTQTATKNKAGSSKSNSSGEGGTQGSSSTGNKSFACTVCGKGLARKDKLVIHMRIHTGEKPYICEVCNKAFARRDKLVIHMNKMKHRTPTNVAPLGKRANNPNNINNINSLNNADKNCAVVPERKHIKTEEKEVPQTSSGCPTPIQIPQQPPPQPQTHMVTWNCELCGKIFGNRDDWTTHAKGHLDEKMMGMAQIHHHQQQQQHHHQPHHLSNGIPNPAVCAPPSSAYFPQHIQPYSTGERHFCVVCRQDFGNKTDFMFHVRTHFEGKTPDLDLLSRNCGGLVDTSGLCT